jgi:muramoyltetrapeptide carboxypeptidase
LALEDLDEYKYHIDRMIIALKRAGALDKVIGIAMGSFSDIKDNAENFGQEPYEIIKENFPKNIPLAIGLPFGHESDNEAFITGNTYELEVNDSGSRLAPVL